MAKLTYRCSVITSTGTVDMDELSAEDRTILLAKWSERLSERMSEFYSHEG